MKTLNRTILVLALLALPATPALAGGAITYTDHGEVTDWYAPDVFVCLGEEPWDNTEQVDQYVYYRWVSHTTITPSGAYNIMYSDVNDGTGIGLTTGNRYESHWTWHYHETGRVGETLHLGGTLIWRNLDTGQTQLSTYMVHITVNANGEVVVERIDPWPPDYRCLH